MTVYRDAEGKPLPPDEVTFCNLCEVKAVPWSRVDKCSRACAIRAADLRRRGLPPVDPGYEPRDSRIVRVSRAIKEVRAAMKTVHAKKRSSYKRSLVRALEELNHAKELSKLPPDQPTKAED